MNDHAHGPAEADDILLPQRQTVADMAFIMADIYVSLHEQSKRVGILEHQLAQAQAENAELRRVMEETASELEADT